jgi:hypothetical protein
VIPLGLKDAFNGLDPQMDAAALSKPDGSIPLVQDPLLAKLINQIYGVKVPTAPRNDLVSVFLTGVEGLNMPDGVKASEMLRLNTAIPPCSATCSTLGVLGGDVAGFPNGRRLSDDTIDEALRVVLGVLLPDHQAIADSIGDGVDANDVSFLDAFPYVAYPHSGSDAAPHS